MAYSGYKIPDELYYHEDGAWILVDDDGNARIGLTDFFQENAGEIVYIDLPSVGDEFEQGDLIGKIQTSFGLTRYYAPVTGTIISVNDRLENRPELINKDGYNDGWIALFEAEDLEGDREVLMDKAEYEEWIEREESDAEEVEEELYLGVDD